MSEKTKCTKVTIKPGNSVTVSNSKQDSSVTYGQHYVQKMPEYIEREKLIAWLENMCVSKKIIDAIQNKERFPAADVAEVVRCKDCKKYTDFDATNCKRLEFHFCKKFRNITRETDFCSFGERKEGAENAE